MRGRRHQIAPFFFFNDTATTEIYTLSLHDALPISTISGKSRCTMPSRPGKWGTSAAKRSEEHTSELQSHLNLVCRLLLEKKNSTTNNSKIYGSSAHSVAST